MDFLGLVSRLFDKWADESAQLEFLYDMFNYSGAPDPTIWVTSGSPTVDGSNLNLTPTDSVSSINKASYGTIRVENFYFSDANAMLRIYIDASNYIEAWSYKSPNQINFRAKTPSGMTTFAVPRNIPGTYDIKIEWSATGVLVYVDSILYQTLPAWLSPSGDATIYLFGASTGTSLIDEIRIDSVPMRARLRVLRTRRLSRFPNYVNLFQADAIMSLPTDHGYPLEIGSRIIANDIIYEAKELIEIKWEDAVLVERWALFRDLTAPSQVQGLR